MKEWIININFSYYYFSHTPKICKACLFQIFPLNRTIGVLHMLLMCHLKIASIIIGRKKKQVEWFVMKNKKKM